jgi:hypothetical protein
VGINGLTATIVEQALTQTISVGLKGGISSTNIGSAMSSTVDSLLQHLVTGVFGNSDYNSAGSGSDYSSAAPYYAPYNNEYGQQSSR